MRVDRGFAASTFDVKALSVRACLLEQMTRAQGLRLKRLSKEAYQPDQYARNLTFDEAARRIAVLEAEIALANSF